MKILPLITCVVFILSVRPADRAEGTEDIYSLNLVRFLLKQPPGISFSVIEKQIHRGGDRLAIGFVKVLDEADLRDPQTIAKILPAIRESFAYPQLISIEEDRKPKVAFLLLRCLQQNSNDPHIRQEIARTIESIKEKTGG